MAQEMNSDLKVGVSLYLGICAVWLFGMVTVNTLQWYRVIPDMRVIDRVCEGIKDIGQRPPIKP